MHCPTHGKPWRCEFETQSFQLAAAERGCQAFTSQGVLGGSVVLEGATCAGLYGLGGHKFLVTDSGNLMGGGEAPLAATT